MRTNMVHSERGNMRQSHMRRFSTVATLMLSTIIAASCIFPKYTADRDVDAGESSSSSSSTSSGSSSGSSSSSSGVVVPDAGKSNVFDASCSGTVACPGVDPCADWSYVIVDDGTTSHATANVKLRYGTNEQCVNASDGPTMPMLAPSDAVALQCGGGSWSFSIDRSSLIVYIVHDPMTGDPPLSWTPACK